MIYRVAAITALLAIAEARFGQEQVPIQAISAVQGGNPGEAATIAGAAISDLLAGSNACDKLARADEIIATLGNGADALAAAIGMVSAEKNVNPFNSQTPTVCSDPSLPSTEALRGITPLIDPDFDDADIANQLSASSVANPLDATGKSVFDLLVEAGVANVQGQDASGNAAAGGNAGNGGNANNANNNNGNNANNANNANNGNGANNNANNNNNNNDNANNNANNGAADNSAALECGGVDNSNNGAADSNANNNQNQNNNQNNENQNQNQNNNNAGNAGNANAGAAAQQSTIAGLDFGQCVPTIKFEGGLGGRPDTEFTFLPIDPLVAQGQQEALNPNIITNRICDQLTNVCDANDAAKAACLDAKAQIQALGTRNKSTADAWNEALGFAGTVTNPSGGAEDVAAAKRTNVVRRSFRA